MEVSSDPAPPPTPSPHRPPQGASLGPRATVGATTITNVGKGGENQDTFINSASGSKCLVGVLDGHGKLGHHCSEFAKTTLTRHLFGHKDLHFDPASALRSAFKDTQRAIERHHQVEAQYSGTTAVAAYQHRDRLFVANVGDSRAVLGRCDTAALKDGETEPRGRPSAMRAVELSSDQKPSRADERRRITEQGGVVQQSVFPVQQRLVRMGPERVWDSTGRCGLCVSRSLGDLCMRPYVTAHPEVSERQLDSKDRLLVIGSDGVWDHMKSQEAVDIAARCSDPQAAAREIAGVARQRWHSETGGQFSDDITAVVVHLDARSDSDNRSCASRGSTAHGDPMRSTASDGFGASSGNPLGGSLRRPPPSGGAGRRGSSSGGGRLTSGGGRLPALDRSRTGRFGGRKRAP